MTKVKSRWVVAVCGVLLLILGLIPKVGAVVSDLPGPAITSTVIAVFLLNILFNEFRAFPPKKRGVVATALGANAVVAETDTEV